MIVTLTPNPGLDLTYTFPPDTGDVEVHRARTATLEASGKGVNVSRALARAGVATCAVLPVAGGTGRHLRELLGQEGVACRTVAQEGETRVNTTALRPGGETLKLNGPGARLAPAEQADLLAATAAALQPVAADGHERWLAMCGSLPPGMEPSSVAEVVSLAHRHGARVAVDASGSVLVAALAAGADLLAPNQIELAEILPEGRLEPGPQPVSVLAEVARELSRSSGAELLVSLGPDGALWTDGREVLHGWGPPLTPVNTAGAGDALLAGWLVEAPSPRDRLARAVAWGRSACLAATTVDPHPGRHGVEGISVVPLEAPHPASPPPRAPSPDPASPPTPEGPHVSAITRVIVTAEHEVTLTTVEAPRPVAGEALVRSVLSGVCGSDTHAQHGRHPHIALPYAPGHEVVGVVDELGEGVSEVAVGDRVTVEPTLPCWHCKQCLAGRQNLCENLAFFGCGYAQGGMAQLFTVPANRLHRVPDEMDDVTASLIEPLSTPVHAVRLAGSVEGKAVAILGAGTIGLLVLAVVRSQGAARVVVSDVLESKRDRALRLGADVVVDARAADVVDQVRSALGESADVVFDCVAIQSTVDQAVGMARKAGTVVIVGVPSAPVTLDLPVVQDEQVRVQGAATYLPQDYAASIELLRSGAVRSDDMVTATFPLEQAAEAFAASTSGDQVKVLVRL